VAWFRDRAGGGGVSDSCGCSLGGERSLGVCGGRMHASFRGFCWFGGRGFCWISSRTLRSRFATFEFELGVSRPRIAILFDALSIAPASLSA